MQTMPEAIVRAMDSLQFFDPSMRGHRYRLRNVDMSKVQAILHAIDELPRDLVNALEPEDRLLFRTVVEDVRRMVAGSEAKETSDHTEVMFRGESDVLAILQGLLQKMSGAAEARKNSTVARPSEWRVVRSLTPGKQGVVDLVERFEPEHQRGVMKHIAAQHQEDPTAVERLKREVNVLREIDHPFVVRVLDAELDDVDPWIVTEWAPFGSLQQHAVSFKGDAWRTLRVTRDLANGLAAVHLKQIVHRDIKPMNVFLRSLEHAVIGDFGIAHDASEETLTPLDIELGGWFRPEMDMGEEPTPAFDVYSLGKLIYWLLSGGVKYRREYFEEGENNLVRHLKRPELEEVNVLLRRMIAEKKKDRIQSMPEVIATIDATIGNLFGGRNGRRDPCLRCATGNYLTPGQLSITNMLITLLNEAGRTSIRFDDLSPRLYVCDSCGDTLFRIMKRDPLKAHLKPS